MANIRIYLHGRPQGQDLWSVCPDVSEDMPYIKSYLDSRFGQDAEGALIVDTLNDNTYYTYVQRRHVIEKENRPDAYFAVTVCICGGYWCNVNWLYRLLEKIYNLKCVGLILKETNGYKQFLIRGFNEIDHELRGLDQVIRQNIENQRKFIMELPQPIAAEKSQPQKYSLEDVDSPAFYKDSRCSTIVISKEYPTKSSILAIQEKKISELNAWKKAQEGRQEKTYSSVTQSSPAVLQKKEDEIRLLKDEIARLRQHRIDGDAHKREGLFDKLSDFVELLTPFARLLASRFREGDQTTVPAFDIRNKESNIEVYHRWGNTICEIAIVGLFVYGIVIWKDVSKSVGEMGKMIGKHLPREQGDPDANDSTNYGNSNYEVSTVNGKLILKEDGHDITKNVSWRICLYVPAGRIDDVISKLKKNNNVINNDSMFVYACKGDSMIWQEKIKK